MLGRWEERARIRQALCAALAAVSTAGSAAAEQGAAALAAAESGGLWVREDPERAWRGAPEVATEVAITVTGLVARARIEQRFTNPGDQRVEAVYVFPLPEGATVESLELLVDERRIVGEVRERVEAERTYRAAVAEGRRAALVEQSRPNLFRVEVAGIDAGAAVTVRLAYRELVRYDLGRFRLRLPLVVGPRFTPDGTGSGAGAAFGVEPPPATPVAPPGAVRRTFRFTAMLDPGVPLAGVESPTHALRVARPGPDLWRVELARGDAATDRDLELVWTPARSSAPRLARFEEEVDGERYAALLFLPPPPDAPAAALARELVVVLDTSGSMGGASIAQAKRAVAFALERLAPFDRFNIVRFASDASALFPAPVAAGPRALAEAREFVGRLAADGGTVMLPALELALDPPADPTVVRQVLFVTDGCVGNEEQLFAFLETHLGDARLFTVGIGSAPNSFFLARAAELGRGTHTFVGRVEEVESKMAALLAKLERPVLADLEVVWDDPAAESYPAAPPDLYVGEPLLLLARLDRPGAAVSVRGARAGSPFEATLAAARPRPASGLAQLWARRKLDGLEAAFRRPDADRAGLRAAIVDLALAHRLASRFTSFVAVEETPSAAPGERPVRRTVPAQLPAGWTGAELPQGATRAPLELWLAVAAALVGAALWGLGARSTWS